MMPTAAKLIAAVFFAALGYGAAVLTLGNLTETINEGWIREIMAAFGFVMGWMIAGGRAAEPLAFSLAAGLTTSAAILFWSVFFVAGYEMIILSMRGAYRGPFHAIESMVAIGAERAMLATHWDTAALLVLGGFAGGWLAHMIARVWR